MFSFVFESLFSYYAIGVLALIFVFITHSQGLKGPTPLPIIGTILGAFFNDAPTLLVKKRQKYGQIYGEYNASSPLLVIGDPVVVKEILIKQFNTFTNKIVFRESFQEVIEDMIILATNKKWKRIRKLITPAFTTGKIKRMKPLIEQCLHNSNEFLDEVVKNGDSLNLNKFWSRFSLEVIACCCFGTNINAHKNENTTFFKHAKGFFKPSLSRVFKMAVWFTMPHFVFKLLNITLFPTDSIDYFSKLVLDLLKQRREIDGKFNDFLQLLVEAEKETNEALTENEIIANCLLFLAGGNDTIERTISFCCFLLAMNEDVQNKLHDELTMLFHDKENIDYESANSCPYLDAVISETLRLYPPFVTTERTASADFELHEYGIKIPANTVVSVPIFAMHRDEAYFPEPEKFKPERFLGINRESIDPYAYLPFGAGPRNCVAMRFAVIEVKLAIIHTLLKFKFVPNEKTPRSTKFLKYTAFVQTNDIVVDVVKR